MMEWKNTKIGDIIKSSCSGGTPKSTVSEYYGGGIPWLNTKEIDFNFIYNTEKTITEEGLKNSSAKWIDENCVIVAMYGATAGKVAINKIPLTTNQACCNLSIDAERADYHFVYYALKDKYLQLASLANGGAQQNLNSQIIKDFELTLPPLPLQRRISSILTSLDRKIELNHSLCQKLEEMASTLFRAWFIDFLPFKNQELIDSPLGRIPKGWKVGNCYKYLDIVYGAPYKSKLFNDAKVGLPLIRIRDLKTCEPAFYTEEILPQTEFVEYGDVVAGMDAEFAPYIWKGEKGLLNQRVLKIKPKDGISPLYGYFLLKPHLNFVQSYKVGTTVSHLGKRDIDLFKVIEPTIDVVKQFSAIADPILNEIVCLSKETKRLTSLRDTLLPRLMSGEIAVLGGAEEVEFVQINKQK